MIKRFPSKILNLKKMLMLNPLLFLLIESLMLIQRKLKFIPMQLLQLLKVSYKDSMGLYLLMDKLHPARLTQCKDRLPKN